MLSFVNILYVPFARILMGVANIAKLTKFNKKLLNSEQVKFCDAIL